MRENPRNLKIGECDCFCSFIVVERDDDFVIIEKDSVDKYVYESAAVFKFVSIKGSEMLQPTNDLRLGDGWLSKLFFCNLNI